MFLTLSAYSDTVILSSTNVVESVNRSISPRVKALVLDTSSFQLRGFFYAQSCVAGVTSTNCPNRGSKASRDKNRLGSVSNFTTKDMAAKAVPDQTASVSEPSRHIVAVVTRQNVAWKECPDIGFNVDSGRSINRPSELSTSSRRRWC